MTRELISIAEAAHMLIEYARGAGLREFPKVAEEMLQDTSPDEIAAIGELLPDDLRELLPKRTLH